MNLLIYQIFLELAVWYMNTDPCWRIFKLLTVSGQIITTIITETKTITTSMFFARTASFNPFSPCVHVCSFYNPLHHIIAANDTISVKSRLLIGRRYTLLDVYWSAVLYSNLQLVSWGECVQVWQPLKKDDLAALFIRLFTLYLPPSPMAPWLCSMYRWHPNDSLQYFLITA